MKRAGNLMPKIVDVDNLMLAFCKARRGKQYRQEVIDYSMNVINNLLSLRTRLMDESLQVGNYHYFEIYDPKQRKICAASFEERVVHHAVVNICKERFEQHLIYDTYATREGKGVYAAIERAREAIVKYPYVAKLDIRKYFDSIDHVILKFKLRRLFKDNQLLRLLDAIIDSYCTKHDKGIPIGNLTSQYFANYYLSDFDHYIKERLNVPMYVRYMDDMLLFAKTRVELIDIVGKVTRFLADNLLLELKLAQIVNVNKGVSFLGYVLLPHRVMLNRRSKLRFVQKMREYTLLLKQGLWSDDTYRQHMQPLLAFVDKAYTFKMRASLCNIYKDI